MKIGIASDHNGFNLKEQLKTELMKRNFEVTDYGTNSDKSTDYPDYAFLLGESVRDGKVDFGVAICGAGIGMSIACNKVRGVRCAKVSTKEEAIVTRNDNNSNIVAFGNNIPIEKALEIVINFISTPFSDEERHHRRVDKITEYEGKK